MTKITIELGGIKAVVEDVESNVDLPGAMELIEQALRGVGFVFDGSLELVEEVS